MKRKLFAHTWLLAGTLLLALFTVFQLADRLVVKPSLAAGKTLAVQSPERFPLNVARRGHTMTALPDGRVVIIGGENESDAIAEAEILNPSAGSLTVTSRMLVARSRHTATLLSNGRVLVIGGTGENRLLNSTEWFNPSTGEFMPGPGLNRARAGHTATLLSDGRLLVAGGGSDLSAEIFDLASGRFTLLRERLGEPRSFHSAALLKSGDVLLVGGIGKDGQSMETAELFNVLSLSFTPLDHSMLIGRLRPALRVLPDGKVQVIGGDHLGTMQVYDPAEKFFRGVAALMPTAEGLSADMLSAQARAIFIRGKNRSQTKRIEQAANPLTTSARPEEDPMDWAEYSAAEIAGTNRAVIADGVDPASKLVQAVLLTKNSPATVATNQILYWPGESPIISGQGWQPGERISIIRQESKSGKRRTLSATADEQGNFTNAELKPDDYQVSLNYVLTAIGEASGYVAQTSYKDATPVKSEQPLPDKTIHIQITVPAAGKGGSKQTEAGLVTWKPTMSAGIAASPETGFSGGVDFPTGPCLGFPVPSLCGAFDVRFLSGGIKLSGDISTTLSIDVKPKITPPFFDLEISGGITLSESFSAKGVLQITGNGTIPVIKATIVPIVGFSFKIGSLAEAKFGISVVAGLDLTFEQPTTVQIPFDFQQEIKKMGVTTGGLVFESGTNSFAASVNLIDGGKVCGKVFVGPEAGFGLSVNVDVPAIPAFILDAGGVSALFDGFMTACVEPLAVRSDCLKFRVTLDAGIEGSASASLLGLVSADASAEFYSARLLTQDFVLKDDLPPVITGTNVTVSTIPGQCSALVDYMLPAVSDTCSGVNPDSLSCSPPPGSVFVKGITTVNCTVSDNFKHIGSGSFTVNVLDVEKPVLQGCVSNLNKTTDPGQCSAVTSFTLPQAMDNCAGVMVSSSLPPGTAFPKGVTTVTVTATDASGNQSTCSFTVMVTDNEAPAAACPANITQSTDPGLCSAVVKFNPTATDNCPGVTMATSIPSGAVFPKGITTVTATATDAAGNKTSCSFTVTVIDTELPVLGACPASITQSTDPGLCSAVVKFNIPTATDNCPEVTVTTSIPSGAVFPKGVTTVTVTATDTSGNKTACSFTVTVVDTEAPVIGPAWPNPAILASPDGSMRNVRINYEATDNCPGLVNKLTISANELDKGTDDPGTPLWGNDWEIINDHQVRLRAERTQHGNGRIYFITISSTDAAGNQAVKKTVTVKVPRQP